MSSPIATESASPRPSSGNGKVAVVTGAGTGIGRQTALALLREGYAVALAGRRADPLLATVALAGADGKEVADRNHRIGIRFY